MRYALLGDDEVVQKNFTQRPHPTPESTRTCIYTSYAYLHDQICIEMQRLSRMTLHPFIDAAHVHRTSDIIIPLMLADPMTSLSACGQRENNRMCVCKYMHIRASYLIGMQMLVLGLNKSQTLKLRPQTVAATLQCMHCVFFTKCMHV